MMFFTVQQAESVYGEKKVFCAKLLCRKRGKVLHSIINTFIREMGGGVFSSDKNKSRIPRYFLSFKWANHPTISWLI
jgi:hypothetical protein